MLKRARQGTLNDQDVKTLNRQVAVTLPIPGSPETIIVVQTNKIRHLLTRLQIEQYARVNRQDIIIFPALHLRNKMNGAEIVQHEILFNLQDGEGDSVAPGLFYYCKNMPARLLANLCIPFGIVTGHLRCKNPQNPELSITHWRKRWAKVGEHKRRRFCKCRLAFFWLRGGWTKMIGDPTVGVFHVKRIREFCVYIYIYI